MQEQPHVNPDFLIDALRDQRNELTDALAMTSAKLREAAQMNQQLIAYLNDAEFLKVRLEELAAATAPVNTDAEPEPEPDQKPKRRPKTIVD